MKRGRKKIGMKRRLNLTKQYIIIIVVCVLLLAINIGMGLLLTRQSRNTMQKLLSKHMISVADTASAMIDGDVFETITREDWKNNSESYRAIAEKLLSVQKIQHDTEIKFIYTIKKDDDKFIYVVDPDPDPATATEYGEKIVYTPMQDKVWNTGKCGADDKRYADEYGNFYSAWSPIKNSAGEVVGIVGVDFDSGWYDAQVSKSMAHVILISGLSLVIGALIVLLLTRQLRARFRSLNNEIVTLSGDVEKLSDEIKTRPDEDEDTDEAPAGSSDAIGVIGEKIRTMQKKLKAYMQYAEEQAYTDSMTGVGNKTAYLDRIKTLGADINGGMAEFAIAVFDINGLKGINDNYGHECGDRIITDAAKVIRRVFTAGEIYRIGGDEFIAVLGPTTEDELEEKFQKLAAEEERFNKEEKRYAMTLSFSWGGAVYVPGHDADFKEVFKRADQAMYREKSEHYSRLTPPSAKPKKPRDGMPSDGVIL